MSSTAGSIPIPDVIMAELPAMSACEAMCTIVLVSATYGNGRQRAWLTYAHFQKQTMYKGKATICKALKAVVKRGFFRRREQEGSNWEVVDAPAADGDSSCLTEGSICEPSGSLSETGNSLSEADGSVSAAAGSDPSPQLPKAQKDGPESGPQNEPDGAKIDPLPLYKERESKGKVRGRERKGAHARVRRDDGRVVDTGDDAPRAGGRGRLQVTDNRGVGRTEMPRARTDEEKALVRHPAVKAWLEMGMAWPGWEKLDLISRRIGREPKLEMMRQAREMWLMAGYRMDNSGGILDWYESLCRDANWYPFPKSNGRTNPSATNMNAPQSASMAMLLKMREEIINDNTTDDSGLFNHAAGFLPTSRARTANDPGLPIIAG